MKTFIQERRFSKELPNRLKPWATKALVGARVELTDPSLDLVWFLNQDVVWFLITWCRNLAFVFSIEWILLKLFFSFLLAAPRLRVEVNRNLSFHSKPVDVRLFHAKKTHWRLLNQPNQLNRHIHPLNLKHKLLVLYVKVASNLS